MSDWEAFPNGHSTYLQSSAVYGPPPERSLAQIPVIGVTQETIEALTDAEIGSMLRRSLPALRSLLQAEDAYRAEEEAKMRHRSSRAGGPRGRMTALYLMHCLGRYKVGVSRAPDKRLAQIQIGAPSKVDIVQSVWFNSGQEACAAETVVHEALKVHQVHGEWFATPYEPDLFSLIGVGQ